MYIGGVLDVLALLKSSLIPYSGNKLDCEKVFCPRSSSTVNERGMIALHLDSVQLIENMDDLREHGFTPGRLLVNGFRDGQNGHRIWVTIWVLNNLVLQQDLPFLRILFHVRYLKAESVLAILRYGQKLAGLVQAEVVVHAFVIRPPCQGFVC